ncbi:MAG: hypothetical protein ACT4OD_03380 [Candidatus Nitrosotenuis sp.]
MPSHVLAFEPIPITISGTMDKIIFDGKWTNEFEWKASSLNTYGYENDVQIVLRSAHQDDFVYVFLDAITDYSQDELNDYAIICFDTKNNKSIKPDLDDYCFMTYLNDKHSFVYQGGYDSEKTDFKKLVNPDGFIGISVMSDANDRYTAIPHPSYEFRIPTNLIGRESIYGFYFLVYDGNSQKTYSYPQNLDTENFVSNPSQWGEIYSPDKSLPEFYLPPLIIIAGFSIVIILTKIKNGKISLQ